MKSDREIRARIADPFERAELDRVVERALATVDAPRRGRHGLAVALAAVVALVALALLFGVERAAPLADAPDLKERAGDDKGPWRAASTEAASGASGPLRIVGGDEPRVFASQAHTPEAETELSDRSRVRVEPGTHVDVVENDGHRFVLEMQEGNARFAVTPGGPRRWSVHCHGVEVAIVGTELAVSCTDASVRVEVMHGAVEVLGDRVPRERVALAAPNAIEIALVDEAPSTSAPEARDVPRVPATAPASAPEETPTVLLDRADEARLAGRPAEAAQTLERLLAMHPDAPDAGSAAFTLGRIRADALDDPAGAAEAFALALELGLPRALEESALARLAEAREATGDVEGAQAARDELARRHPESRFLHP